MKLEDFAKKISISKKVLEGLGLESEASEGSYAESLKDLMTRINRDFESLLHPEMGFSVMIEHSYLDETDIKTIFEIFKAYNKTLREYEIAKLDGSLITWSKEFFVTWEKFKGKVIAINKKIAKSWTSHDTKSLMLEYLG